MVIILRGRISFQLKIGLSYLAILLMVLVLMNTYPLVVSQDLVFQAKHASLKDSAAAINTALSGLGKLTESNVSQAMESVKLEGISRAIVTDPGGRVLYDTREVGAATDFYIFYTELVEALRGNTAIYSVYRDGAFHSSAAQPVLYRNEIIGGIYVYEYDTQQASLLETLRNNLLTISLCVGLLAVVLAMLFSRSLTRRLGSLQNAIRGVREGAYNQRAILSGQDEFTQIAEEFNDLVDRLQEIESARRQFVSDASHELKTPLAAIQLLTDSILQNEDIDRDTAREFVSDIGHEADRLTGLTEDLLRLTRLDSGLSEPPHPVAVAPVLDRVVRMLRPVASAKEIELKVNCGDDTMVRATEGDLHQILYNLAENAIKYNRRRGFVHIQVETGEDDAVILVEDNGIGIPEEDLTHIFKRFYRVDKARSRAAGGTGLGLSIVRDTVSRLGGSVWADNRPEGGARFTATLPLAGKAPDDPEKEVLL